MSDTETTSKRELSTREIDALVADHVMGLSGPWGATFLGGKPLPHYSTDIAAAWEVVEKVGDIKLEGYRCVDGCFRWCVTTFDLDDIEIRADTAPMAICLAALKAKGVEV